MTFLCSAIQDSKEPNSEVLQCAVHNNHKSSCKFVGTARRLGWIQHDCRTILLLSIVAQMLRICSLAGEAVATFNADELEGKSVKQLKIAVAKQIAITRFRQRWLKDDTELKDEAVVPCCDVQLVVRSFAKDTAQKELRQLTCCLQEKSSGATRRSIAAAPESRRREGKTKILECFLCGS